MSPGGGDTGAVRLSRAPAVCRVRRSHVITSEEIRRYATAFPEVEEDVHHVWKLPVFKVRGKVFAGMDRGGRTAVFSISQEDAAAVVAAEPAVYEEVWRNAATRSFVGLRVDLAKVSTKHIRELIEGAWRNKAPKRLVATHDAG
nr:MmcQ/YjbR family DNA-binding protein [Actinopolymorpha pittospori]